MQLPYNYSPRPYQIPFLHALDTDQYKRAVLIWHRRSGKDKSLINFISKKMYERVGSYYYFFPTFTQGRKVIWDGMDRDGFRFLNHFPVELMDGLPNNTEMKLKYKNGSMFQIIGTDNIDSIVGTNPIGCVFSEYALQNPIGWDYMRPILAENGGWAVFNYTPRGNNHGKDLYDMALEDKTWYTQLLTVKDTKAIPQDVLDQEYKEIYKKYGNDALYQQEYMCSFESPIFGAYYSKEIKEAEADGRFKDSIPFENLIPVDTWWDLGMSDKMSIWFTQNVGREVHVIDYYENSGEGLAHYIKKIQEKRYIYGTHNAPHDIEVRELGTGKSRKETAYALGITFNVVRKLSLDDGIDAVRNIFSKCYFDKKKCEQGIKALKNYHHEYDEEKKEYKSQPEHDWSSHASDAFRTFAVGHSFRFKSYTNINSRSFNPMTV